VSLISSRIVSMTFMPLLGFYVLRGQKGFRGLHRRRARGAAGSHLPGRFVQWCMGHKAVTLGSAGLAFTAGCAALPLLGTAFFPKDLHDVFTVNVFMAEGSPIRQTREEALRVIRAIEELSGEQIPRLHHVCRRGWAAVLALDHSRAARGKLRANPRSHHRQNT